MYARLGRALSALLRSPILQILVAILIGMSGLLELLMLPEEVGEQRLNGHHGIIALAGAVFLKALLHFMEGADLAGESVRGLSANGTGNLHRRFARFLDHWAFHMLIALFAVICGLIEGWEAWEQEAEIHQRSVWHVGLIAAGLSIFLKSCAEFVDAFTFYRKSLEEGGRPVSLVDRFGEFVALPKVEVALALFVIFIGIWEEWVAVEEHTAALSPHHGLLFFGLLQLGHAGQVIATHMDLVVDAVEREESKK